MRFVRLATSLLILAVPSIARAISATGTFVETGRRTPLAAVEVVLRRAADSTLVAHAVTAADGRFRIAYRTSDPTYVQTSTNRSTLRRFGLAAGWSWGKPPETKPRRPTEEQPQDQPLQTH